MDIAKGNIGTEANYEIDIVGKDLVASFNYAGAQLSSATNVKLDLVAILEKIKEKIPGTIDDAIIGVVESALKATAP